MFDNKAKFSIVVIGNKARNAKLIGILEDKTREVKEFLKNLNIPYV